MKPLRFCANLTTMFNESNHILPDKYEMAKKFGFKGVELAFPYDYSAEELRKVKEKFDIEQILINTFPGNDLGLAAMIGKETEFMNSLLRSIDYCKQLNCKRLHIMSGKPVEKSSLDVFKNNLMKAVPILEDNEIIGLIEPINQYSVPGYALSDYNIAETVIHDIGSKNLLLQLDIFHLQFIKGDLTNNIKKYLPITGHIQIAQVPDRHEPNSEGEINYQYIFKTLQSLDYSGWIGLEYIPSTDTIKGLKSWTQEFGIEM